LRDVAKQTRNHGDVLRGASRLVIDATKRVTDVVEARHTTIGGGPVLLGAPQTRTLYCRGRRSGSTVATGPRLALMSVRSSSTSGRACAARPADRSERTASASASAFAALASSPITRETCSGTRTPRAVPSTPSGASAVVADCTDKVSAEPSLGQRLAHFASICSGSLRRARDSNPWYLSVHLISNQAPSATRSALHRGNSSIGGRVSSDGAPQGIAGGGGGLRTLPGRPTRRVSSPAGITRSPLRSSTSRTTSTAIFAGS
jgi:hypothetical protein